MAQQEIAIMEDPAGQSQPWRAVHGGIEYGGEIISAREWRPEWGQRLPDELFFRIVFLASAPRRARFPLDDRRIAVCLPRRTVDWTRAAGALELRSVREARARYVTQPGPESAPVRAALAEQERALRQQILEESARQFAGGRVIVSEDQVLDARALPPISSSASGSRPWRSSCSPTPIRTPR